MEIVVQAKGSLFFIECILRQCKGFIQVITANYPYNHLGIVLKLIQDKLNLRNRSWC